MTFSKALHRFTWTISDFNLADPDVDLESLWFRAYYIHEVEFRLVLTPRGDADPSAVSLWLQRKRNDVGPAKLKVKFEIGLVDAFGVDRNGKAMTGEFERNSKCGFEVFLPRSEVLDFLQRGAITIYFKIHAETFQCVSEDFDYKRGFEEFVVEKLVDSKKSNTRLEAKLFPPGIDVKFRFEGDKLNTFLVPLEAPKEDLEVYGRLENAEKYLSNKGQKFIKDEMASLVLPAVCTSDLKKDVLKLKVNIMDMKPVVTTKKHEKKSKGSIPSLEYTVKDLYLKAKDGGFNCTSFPLIAHSPRLYRAVSEDDWLHWGLPGRIDDLPEVNQVKEGTVKITRKPGCTVVHLPDLSKSALETVYKYLDGEEDLQIEKETVEDIYQVGRVLEIPLIGDICVAEYWKKNMTTDSVLDILKFGSSLSDEDHKDILTNVCLDHIHRYMKEILSSNDWRNFLAKDKDLAEIVLNHLKECEGQREIV